ncbi:ABC transporter permease [Cryobacterium sp. Hz9]|nr:ABC transporter permease [Cryobacterium sp. Hz9]
MAIVDRNVTPPRPDSPPTQSEIAPRSAASGNTSRVRQIMSQIPGPLIGLIVIFVALSFLSPYFLTPRNLLNILSQVSAVGVMSVGALLIILLGGIDLSVGSVLALSSMSMAAIYKMAGWPFEVALLAGLIVGALVGLINGILTAYGKLQPFIATLATMSAAAGLALFITNGNPITGFPDWFIAITATSILGVPIEGVILVAIFATAAFWLKFRPSGRALYAIGGNEEVARLSGLSVRRAKILVYTIAGLLAAVAGLLVTSRLDSAQPTAGAADLLNVIAVVVIGGASLSGGSGSLLGTFVGLLIIGVLNNGMSLLNVSANLQPVVIGAVIAAAVLTDRKSSRRHT